MGVISVESLLSLLDSRWSEHALQLFRGHKRQLLVLKDNLWPSKLSFFYVVSLTIQIGKFNNEIF